MGLFNKIKKVERKLERDSIFDIDYPINKNNWQVISTFLILSCILFLLVGCTGESRNESNPLTKKEDSVTPPEVVYDSALLPYISIQEGYYIADYGKSLGENYSYAVFNMCRDDDTEDTPRVYLYWEIVVMQENDVITVLHVEKGEYGDNLPTSSEMVIETDVNFDGKHDILICLGHFGSQGFVTYKCFLSTDDGFVHCPGFTEIANPALDNANLVIRSQWRNSSTSHSWGIFKFIKDEFVETERLTEAAIYNAETGELIWSWSEDVFFEGKWQTKAYYTENDFDSETIENKLYEPDSYWGLDQSKWNTLFNEGKMFDSSVLAR